MEEFTKIISSPIWWISTVLAAFIVNILASFTKQILDGILSKWSNKRKSEVESARKREAALVYYLTSETQHIIDIRTDAIYTAMKIIIVLTAAVFVYMALEIFPIHYFLYGEIIQLSIIILYIVILISAVKNFRRFWKLRRIINKCNASIYTYDNIPIETIVGLEKESKLKP